MSKREMGMKTKPVLLPCPFCGSKARVLKHPLTGDKYFAAACINTEEGCWASDVPATAICDTREKAAEVWNTRWVVAEVDTHKHTRPKR